MNLIKEKINFIELKDKIASYFEKSVNISGNFNTGGFLTSEAYVQDVLDNKIGQEIFRIIKNYTKDPETIKILDMGCGLGGLLLACQTNSVSAMGIEIDPSAAEIAKLRIADSQKVILGDCENLPFSDNSFDMITSVCVIEHVKNPDKYIAEARRVLKPGGRLIVFAPNNFFPWEGHYKSFWLPYLLPYTKKLFKLYLKARKRAPRFVDFINLKITPGFLKKKITKAGFAEIEDLSVLRFKERLDRPELLADAKVKKILIKMKKHSITRIMLKIFTLFLKISRLYHPIILVAIK